MVPRSLALVALILGSCGGGSGGADGGGGGGDGGPGSGDGAIGAADAAPAVDCATVTCHHVRAGAPAGGDGAGWATAWGELPEALERGHVYYVAAGSYPGYTFDDAVDGDRAITVLRATAADHGAGDGWDAAYDGVARFGPSAITTGFHVLDGRGRGIVLDGAFEGTVLTIAGDDVTLRSLEVDGGFTRGGDDRHEAGACSLLESGATRLAVIGCDLHDAADDGVVLYGARDVRFEGNQVHALHGCGTDGGCGPCFNGHSDGLELFDVEGGAIRANFIYDVQSTATVFFGNWGDETEYVEDLTIENNVFYAPDVGLVAYVHYARDVRLLHNVFWGVRGGAYGGLSIGPEVTGLQLHNNVILSINLDHTGGTFDAAEHHASHNVLGADLGQFPLGDGDVVAADPGFAGIPGTDGPEVDTPTAEGFALEPGSPAIDTAAITIPGITLPTTDYFGRPRGAAPDVGPIER